MEPLTARNVRRAIAGGQLEVVYQPEVDLRTGHIAAVEALVRWRQPKIGLTLPAQFIPIAESTGQIGDLTMAVLGRSLAQAAKWQAARWDREALPIWVNLSACELGDDRLAGRITDLIDKHAIAPSQLGLEVTETAPILDTALAVATLESLHASGVRIAIDDFGTGYSSLSHLRDLPIDVVKIDRSFVGGVTSESADAAIVTAIIALAHATRRIVVAEGVEDTDQQHALITLGCDLGQGYLYSSPQPAHCIDVLLKADRELATFESPNGARRQRRYVGAAR
jgi:EAL domain-containing protein (putative c-di-GMP-specific phosphodiesterase class I)